MHTLSAATNSVQYGVTVSAVLRRKMQLVADVNRKIDLLLRYSYTTKFCLEP